MTLGNNTYDLETRRASQMTDKQLLAILSQRAGDLNCLTRFESLIRIFEHAATLHPAHAPGLRAAVGLTKLLGSSIQPGHEGNPFNEVATSVAGCFSSVITGKAPPAKERAQTVLVAAGGLPQDDEITRQVVRNVAHRNDPPPSARKLHVRRVAGSGKKGQARAVLETMKDRFTLVGLMEHMPEGIKYCDVQNALADLRKEGKMRDTGDNWSGRMVFEPVAQQETT